MRDDTEGAEYWSAASGNDDSSDGEAWEAGSCSSVDSLELRTLLEELDIVPVQRAGGNKRPLAGGGSLGTSPSTQRPFTSPRLERASGRIPAAATVAAAGGARSLPPAAPPAAAAAAAAAAGEAEVIELLDSSSGSESADLDNEEEEEWRIAAPNTARKNRRAVVDSESEYEPSASGSEAESEEGEEEDSRPALAPFFAAIPSLAAAAAGAQPKRRPAPTQQPKQQPKQQQQQQPAAEPAREQQTAAPPPPRPSSSASLGGSRGSADSLSATAFRRQREALAADLFAEFNRTVFEGRLPADLAIRWNARLLTTAGLTHYKREIPDDPYAPPIYSARVELSAKVLDSFAKLERTLCHELCHVAAWLLDHTAKPPHGPVFRAWAARAMARYAHLDITTCHAYEIFYPFRWQCSNAGCATEYGRHSNSIDVTKKVCGRCRAPLAFLGKFRPDGTPARQRVPNAFAAFVRENAAEIKRALPAGTPHKEVMARVAGMYKEAKEAGRTPGGGGKGRAAAAAAPAAAAAAGRGSQASEPGVVSLLD